mmetsp:Transcript_29934/g.69220  ORF Transcript_29934/g.69220 Transcript_29934/m.69220 type:complete len:404 (+) Transcript_29934:1016-2227(+)
MTATWTGAARSTTLRSLSTATTTRMLRVTLLGFGRLPTTTTRATRTLMATLPGFGLRFLKGRVLAVLTSLTHPHRWTPWTAQGCWRSLTTTTRRAATASESHQAASSPPAPTRRSSLPWAGAGRAEPLSSTALLRSKRAWRVSPSLDRGLCTRRRLRLRRTATSSVRTRARWTTTTSSLWTKSVRHRRRWGLSVVQSHCASSATPSRLCSPTPRQVAPCRRALPLSRRRTPLSWHFLLHATRQCAGMWQCPMNLLKGSTQKASHRVLLPRAKHGLAVLRSARSLLVVQQPNRHKQARWQTHRQLQRLCHRRRRPRPHPCGAVRRPTLQPPPPPKVNQERDGAASKRAATVALTDWPCSRLAQSLVIGLVNVTPRAPSHQDLPTSSRCNQSGTKPTTTGSCGSC